MTPTQIKLLTHAVGVLNGFLLFWNFDLGGWHVILSLVHAVALWFNVRALQNYEDTLRRINQEK